MARGKPTKRSRRRQARKLTRRSVSKSFQQDVKNLRKSLSTLKKLGLAFTRTKPRKTRITKKKREIIASFSDVLEGRASVHKIGKGAKKYREAHLPGQRVIRERLIVPKVEREATYVRRGKLYRKRMTKEGQVISRAEVLPLRLTSTNLQDFFDELRDRPDLEASLAKGRVWSFRFFGNNSYRYFDTLDQIADYFESYPTVQMTVRESLEAQEDVIEAFELFQMEEPPGGLQYTPKRNDYNRPLKKYSRSEYSKTYYGRNKERRPHLHEAQLKRKRKQASEWYNKHKDDVAFLEKKRQYARERYRKMVKKENEK